MINKNSKIFITGLKGLVGSLLYSLLQKKGYKNLNPNKIKALGWKPKIKLEVGIKKILDQKKFKNE